MLKKFIYWLSFYVFAPRREGWFLYTIVALVLTAPMLFIGIFGFFSLYREISDLSLERRQSLASLAAFNLEEKFDHIKDVGISLATRVAFRQLIQQKRWDEAIAILSDVTKNFPYIDRVFLTDSAGILTADSPALPDVRGQSFAFRDWYDGVSKNWEPYVSEIYKRQAAPQLNVAVVAVPIKSGEQILGILVMQIRLETFLSWAEVVEINSGGFAYFVDQRGHAVASPYFPPQDPIADISDNPIVQKVLAGNRGLEIFRDADGGIERVIAYEPVNSYGWGAIVEQPSKAVFEVRNEALRFFLAVLFAAFSMNLFFAYLLVKVLKMTRLMFA